MLNCTLINTLFKAIGTFTKQQLWKLYGILFRVGVKKLVFFHVEFPTSIEGICGIMDTIVGNRHVNQSSDPGWDCLPFTQGKVYIQVFSLQLWVKSKADWAL